DPQQLGLIEGPVRPSYDHGVCPLDSVEGFPQPPERRELEAAERISSVEEKQIQVACQREVLEAVVEHQNLRAQFADGEFPALKPVLIDDDRNIGKDPRQHDRFVTEFVCLRVKRCALALERMIQHSQALRVPAISPGQNGNGIALLLQISRYVFHHRSLACPSDGYVADTDNGCIQTPGCEAPRFVRDDPHPPPQFVQLCWRPKNGPPYASADSHAPPFSSTDRIAVTVHSVAPRFRESRFRALVPIACAYS